MIEDKVKITCSSGLRARAAALFVQVASRFSAHIWIQMDNKKINAKSIMGVMSLNVGSGDDITIHIEGKDEKEAMAAMKQLINSDFEDIPDKEKSAK